MTNRQILVSALVLGTALGAIACLSALAEPPQNDGAGPPSRASGAPDNSPPGRESGPPRRDDGPQDGSDRRPDRPRPQPGAVLPPFVRDKLNLSSDQKKQIADLETDVKAKLGKILTDEQMRQFRDLLRQGPPPRPRDDQEDRNGAPSDGRRGPPPDDRQRPPPSDDRRGQSIEPSPTNDSESSKQNASNHAFPTQAEGTATTAAMARIFSKNVKVSFDDKFMIVESDGIPNHETGQFPNEHNPNSIRKQNYRFLIPLHPQQAEKTTTLPMGPIGVAINGIPFYNQYNAQGKNAVEGPTAEIFDSCCGHPDQLGRYHYHKYPVCIHNPFKDQEEAGKHSPLIGYAFDGFAIYGPNGEDGKPPQDLDECNGHSDSTRGYHYHVTAKFPYILGAYRGVVERANFDHPPRAPG